MRCLASSLGARTVAHCSLFLYLSQSAADLLEVREPKEMSKEEDFVEEMELESFQFF